MVGNRDPDVGDQLHGNMIFRSSSSSSTNGLHLKRKQTQDERGHMWPSTSVDGAGDSGRGGRRSAGRHDGGGTLETAI